MRAICILGSPREDGSTAILVSRVVEGMEAAGIEVECYSLGALNINYCQGGRACESTQRCTQRDDMDLLLEGIVACDIVLLASPSYWGDVTGQMKVFIDRSLPLCDAATGETTVPPGKIGVAVAIRAGSTVGENQHLVDTFEHYFGHLGIEMGAAITVEGIDQVSDLRLRPDKLEEAYAIGVSMATLCRQSA